MPMRAVPLLDLIVDHKPPELPPARRKLEVSHRNVSLLETVYSIKTCINHHAQYASLISALVDKASVPRTTVFGVMANGFAYRG